MLESDDPAQAWTNVKAMSLNEVDLLNLLLDARDETRERAEKRRKERSGG